VSTATPAPPLSLSPAPSPPPPGAAPGLPTPPPLPGLLILLDPPSLRSILIPDERDFIDSARQEAAPSFEKRRPKLGRPAESGAKAVLRPRSFPNASTAPEAMQITPAERARAAAQVPRFMSKRFCYAGGRSRWQRGDSDDRPHRQFTNRKIISHPPEPLILRGLGPFGRGVKRNRRGLGLSCSCIEKIWYRLLSGAWLHRLVSAGD